MTFSILRLMTSTTMLSRTFLRLCSIVDTNSSTVSLNLRRFHFRGIDLALFLGFIVFPYFGCFGFQPYCGTPSSISSLLILVIRSVAVFVVVAALALWPAYLLPGWSSRIASWYHSALFKDVRRATHSQRLQQLFTICISAAPTPFITSLLWTSLLYSMSTLCCSFSA